MRRAIAALALTLASGALAACATTPEGYASEHDEDVSRRRDSGTRRDAATDGAQSPSSDGGATVDAGSPTPSTGWPDETNTGVRPGTALTVVNGDLTITTANAVIEGKDIRGCVDVQADNVTIRNSRIGCASWGVIYNHAATGLLIEDAEIYCTGASGGTAVGDQNFTVRRANIHGCENGFDVDGNVRVEDSYIHDVNNGGDGHADGAQITPVGHDIAFVHNTIFCIDAAGALGTSAIISPPVGAGVVRNVLIQNNLLAGGAYTLYCQQDGAGNNYQVLDNHFSTRFSPRVGAYGPWTECNDEILRGNVIHETGQPVPAE